MEHRPFGRTGLDVSAVGFGCWEVGGGYGEVDEAEFARAVDRALDLGIPCFDTAEGYGMGASERAGSRCNRIAPYGSAAASASSASISAVRSASTSKDFLTSAATSVNRR